MRNFLLTLLQMQLIFAHSVGSKCRVACLFFGSEGQKKRTEFELKMVWFLLISHTMCIQTASYALKAHRQVISKVPAEFGVIPTNDFDTILGTESESIK